MVHAVEAYITGVLDGSIVCGRDVRLAVERHQWDRETAESRGYYFDEASATYALEFFPSVCTHSTGKWAGSPFELSAWQQFIIWVVIGWKRFTECEDCAGAGEIATSATTSVQCDACGGRGWMKGVRSGLRRFRVAYVSMGRKNGKSTFLSAVALLLMVFDDPPEPRAELYVAATKEKQAKLIFDETARMVRNSSTLSEIIQVYKRAMVMADGSTFEPLGSDSDTQDGLNPHVVLKDELHAWRRRHHGLDEVLSSGDGAREQPIEFIITTAGDERSEIWQQTDDYATSILDAAARRQVIDDTYFAFIARIDKGDDPFDQRCWAKANPNLGVSVSVRSIRTLANVAKNVPTALNELKQKKLNVKVSSKEKPIMPELWERGNHPISLDKLAAGPCYGGFDLGRSADWSAIAIVFGESIEIDGKAATRYHVKQQSWTCEDSKDVDVNRSPYREWIDAGWLRVSTGNAVDHEEIMDTIVAWKSQFNVATWDYDPNFAETIGQTLIKKGIVAHPMFQTHRNYNEAIRLLIERCLPNGLVMHGGDECLAWQAANLVIAKNNRDEWMPDKVGSLFKIDAVVAILMALQGALFGQTKPTKSIYETAGSLRL